MRSPRHAPAVRAGPARFKGNDVTAGTIRAYEAHAADYVRHWNRRAYRRPRLLRDLLRRVRPGAAVLDLGCGSGQDARGLRRARYRAVGLDLAEPLLRSAQRLSRRLPLVQADMRRLPFQRGSFDAVWAAASLIHLPKPAVRCILVTVRELVAPGGVLAATLAHGLTSGVMQRGWIPGRFISRWHKAEIGRAVRRAGWEILSLQTVSDRERKGRWMNLLARRPAPSESRPRAVGF